MTAVEINFVVPDVHQALVYYRKVFPLEVLEKTNYSKGQNEVVFSIFESIFHMLDENPNYSLIAPAKGSTPSMWINVTLENIEDVYAQAVAAGGTEIQSVTYLAAMDISHAIFKDPFGHVWMLHQLYSQPPVFSDESTLPQ